MEKYIVRYSITASGPGEDCPEVSESYDIMGSSFCAIFQAMSTHMDALAQKINKSENSLSDIREININLNYENQKDD